MSEKYISVSKLKAHYSWLGKDATLSPKDVDDIIDAQPASDVEPVVRGEWCDSVVFMDEENVYSCSACAEPFILISGTPRDNKYNYCPNCGAHMERSGSGE